FGNRERALVEGPFAVELGLAEERPIVFERDGRVRRKAVPGLGMRVPEAQHVAEVLRAVGTHSVRRASALAARRATARDVTPVATGEAGPVARFDASGERGHRRRWIDA